MLNALHRESSHITFNGFTDKEVEVQRIYVIWLVNGGGKV
jgi:hypothetical protein